MSSVKILVEATPELLEVRINSLLEKQHMLIYGYAYNSEQQEYSALLYFPGGSELKESSREISGPERRVMERNNYLHLKERLGNEKKVRDQLGLTEEEARELMK